MPGDSFSISAPEGWFARAQAEAAAAGGQLRGDSNSGEFIIPAARMGDIAGTYTATGSQLQITITKKPFLVSVALIESNLRKRFG